VPDDTDDFKLEPAVEALIEGDDDLIEDTSRHYEQDPNHLAQFAATRTRSRWTTSWRSTRPS